MAVVVRSRRLVNPGRKRRVAVKKRVGVKRKNPAKRKLSPKQIAIFGTARQKAALRASKTRKRNAGTYSIRKTKKRLRKVGVKASMPKARQYRALRKASGVTARGRRAKRKRNIGEIVSISLAGLAGNPGKRKRNSGMAKRRKARRNYGTVVGRSFSHSKVGKRRKKNSGVARRRRSTATHTRRRRRNPVYKVRRVHRRRNAGVRSGVLTGVLGKALGVIGGAVATRYVTQLALGGNNSGVMGYAGNIASAFALSWAVKKFVSQEMGTNVLIGGAVATVLRVIADTTSLGKYINLSLMGAGKGGDVGIGIIQDSSFPLPQSMVPGSQTQAIVPRATRNFVTSQMDMVRAKSATPGVGTVFGRRRVM